MRRLLIATVALALGVSAQQPIPTSQIKQRKEVFRNPHIVVYQIQIAPGDEIPMHTHDRDLLVVALHPGTRIHTEKGKPPVRERFKGGEVWFEAVGLTHATKNVGNAPLRVTGVEFNKGQGKQVPSRQKAGRYCNPGSKNVCVEEKYLFCTDRFCAEDVTFAPGAVSTKHAHATDHMLIAISDYHFKDEVEGKGTVYRNQRSGGVEYIGAGLTHQLTNVGDAPARFIVVAFK
jgi:quercetin dioxygenase-like cupin family protein